MAKIAPLTVLLCLFGCPALAAPPAPLQLEDTPRPLDPKTERSEAEADRIRSASLFAAGRLFQQRGEPHLAVDNYERAFRYHPQAKIAAQLIPLAFSVGRTDEALRYAVLAADELPVDAALMRRLALHLASDGKWDQALKMYRIAEREVGPDAQSPDAVAMQLEIGRICFLTEDYQDSARAFARVQQALDNPDDFGLSAVRVKALLGDAGLTYQLFGEAYLFAGRLDEAAAAFRQAAKHKPTPGMLGYQLARVESKRGNALQAIEHLKEYFQAKQTAKGVRPYELYAELLEQLNRGDAVDEKLKALLEDDPENSPLGLSIARRLIEANKFDRAEKLMTGLLPGAATAHRAALLGELMEIRRRQEDFEPLLETLAQAVQLGQGLDAWEETVAKIAEQEGLAGRLVDWARQRHEDDQQQPGEAQAVAELALRAERFDDAYRFYELAVENQPDRAAELSVEMGLKFFLADQDEQAVEILRRATKDSEGGQENPVAYFYLAGALELSGQTDEALAAAEKAEALSPDAPQFAGRRAWILYHAGRHEEAIAAYQKLIDKLGREYESAAARQAVREARLALSNLYILTDRNAQAEQRLEEILDEFPEDAGALNDLGYLWVDQNKHLQRGLKMVEKAVVAEPDNHAYLDSLGWAYYRLGRYQEAVEQLEQAAAGEEPDAVILDHLGDAYWRAGKKEQAQETWQRALEDFRKHEEPDKARAVEEKLKQNKTP